jgi:hypothetical protein
MLILSFQSKGWTVQNSRNDREVYLSPPKDETSTGSEPPYLAIYRDEKLVGLTIMHSSHIQKREKFQNTM